MKKRTIYVLLAVFVGLISIVCFAINRSYYPMGGEVTVISKQANNNKYYITVEQGEPGNAGWGQFELECTPEQYQAVDVGDVIECDRTQSVVTHKGKIHKIHDSVVEEERTSVEQMPDLEGVSWGAVSVKPMDFGMESTLDNPAFAEVFYNPSAAPLDKLIAFYLIADGLGEGAGDELYARFIDAPHTVLTFLALLDNQMYEMAGQGEVSIAEFICKSIACADVAWHGATTEFDSIIAEYRSYYPAGRISKVLDVLEREHNSAVERNASNYNFTAEVIKYGNDALCVKVTDVGNTTLSFGDELYVPVADGYENYPVGCAVEIAYIGSAIVYDDGTCGPDKTISVSRVQ